jgi:hypothetical protein
VSSAKGGFWRLYGWQLLVGGAITLVYVVVAWSSPEPESLAMRLVWWVGIVGYLALAMVANEWGFGLRVFMFATKTPNPRVQRTRVAPLRAPRLAADPPPVRRAKGALGTRSGLGSSSAAAGSTSVVPPEFRSQ